MKLINLVLAAIFLLSLMLWGQPMDWSRHYSENELNNWIRDVEIDSEGNVLAIGHSSGMLILSESNVNQCANRFFVSNIGLQITEILNCHLKEEIWVFTADTIHIFSEGDYSQTKEKVHITIGLVIGAVELRDSTVIIATETSIHQIFTSGQKQNISRPSNIEGPIVPMFEDRSGYLWFRTSNQGVFRCKNENWENFNKDNSALTSNRFSTTGTVMVEDDDGKLITGAYDEENGDVGVFIYDGNVWSKKTVSTLDNYYNSIRCIAKDCTGVLWLGTAQNVVRVYGDSIFYYTASDIEQYGSPKGFVRDIKVDRQNRVFFGTFHYGVYMLDQNDGFSCMNISRINIKEPHNGEELKSNELIDISWETFGTIDSVCIMYKQEADQWQLIDCVENTYTYPWDATGVRPGRYQMKLSDQMNDTVEHVTGYFRIIDGDDNTNNPPVFISRPESVKVLMGTQNKVSLYASDRDNDSIFFYLSNYPEWIKIDNNELIFSPQNGDSTMQLKVFVMDEHGGVDSNVINVVVESPVEIWKDSFSETGNELNINVLNSRLTYEVNANKLDRIQIYDISGRIVYELRKGDYSGGKRIFEVVSLTNGLYVFYAIYAGVLYRETITIVK